MSKSWAVLHIPSFGDIRYLHVLLASLGVEDTLQVDSWILELGKTGSNFTVRNK